MNAIQTIGNIIEQNEGIFSASPALKKEFGEDNVEYAMLDMPVPPHVIVKHEGRKIVIVHKSYADDPELICCDMAIGHID